MEAKIRTLEEANSAQRRRQSAKKTRLHLGGALSVQEGQDLLTEKDVKEQVQREMRSGNGRQMRAEPDGRRCGTCGERGHNTRTCKKKADSTEE